MRRHQAELKVVQEEMVQALKGKDEEARQELEEERRKLQEQMEKVKKDSEGMALNYATEKARMEAKMKEMEQEAEGERERERTEAEYHRPSTNHNRRPEDTANAPTSDLPRSERRVETLQVQLDDSDDDGLITIPIYK